MFVRLALAFIFILKIKSQNVYSPAAIYFADDVDTSSPKVYQKGEVKHGIDTAATVADKNGKQRVPLDVAPTSIYFTEDNGTRATSAAKKFVQRTLPDAEPSLYFPKDDDSAAADENLDRRALSDAEPSLYFRADDEPFVPNIQKRLITNGDGVDATEKDVTETEKAVIETEKDVTETEKDVTETEKTSTETEKTSTETTPFSFTSRDSVTMKESDYDTVARDQKETRLRSSDSNKAALRNRITTRQPDFVDGNEAAALRNQLITRQPGFVDANEVFKGPVLNGPKKHAVKSKFVPITDKVFDANQIFGDKYKSERFRKRVYSNDNGKPPKVLQDQYKKNVRRLTDIWNWDHWCQLQPRKGKCENKTERYFYDAQLDQCQTFAYSGCDGNENSFKSAEDCLQHCKGATFMTMKEAERKIPCNLQPNSGLCLGLLQKYYYDINEGVCKGFIYGGCGGNLNRFDSIQHCSETCKE